MIHLVQLQSNPGYLICDPFTGSGTTAIACIRTGRRFVGMEQDERYCEIAARRIERELLQPRLLPPADDSAAPRPQQDELWQH
jgi:site-specific DNA-methyltransferase (adenine-specific)